MSDYVERLAWGVIGALLAWRITTDCGQIRVCDRACAPDKHVIGTCDSDTTICESPPTAACGR